MNTDLSDEQVNDFQRDGFLVIDDFLDPTELIEWRTAVEEAITERHGQKIPGKSGTLGEEDGINKDAAYHSKVFDQLVNLWQTNKRVEKMMLDPSIGQMAAKLAGVEGIRIWHDQALIKRPWANPTAWHLDTPFWSFSDRRALSIWVALDDAHLENGCLFFIPGSHKKTGYDDLGIGKNMDSIFEIYPDFKSSPAIAAPMKAGSCSFHNGLTIHGANANMTPGSRRAMTCAYMPDGNNYNGTPNILPEDYLSTLQIGDPLNYDTQNPLIYSAKK